MKCTPDMLCGLLDAMLLSPHTGLATAAKQYGIATSTVWRWQSESARDEKDDFAESPYLIEWLGIRSYWHRHVALARRLSIQQIDAKVREMAVSGSRTKLINKQTGAIFWEPDPQLAADALLGQDGWAMLYGDRPITDIYKRDEHGALIPMYETIEPSAAMLLGAAKALIPEIYGETIRHDHNIQVGGVLRIAASPSSAAPAGPALLSAPRTVEQPILDADFTMAIEDRTVEDAPQPTNTLAVAERPKSVQEFEETFGGRRLTEYVRFYDELDNLLAPSPGIVIIKNSSADKELTAAGIEHDTVTATSQVELGFCNEFLLKLANAEHASVEQTNTKQTRPRSGEDSPLVRDLRAKLAEGVKNPHPTAPVNIGNKEPAGGDQPDDARPRDPQHGIPQQQALNSSGTGRGVVPSGGYRVVK